MPNSKRATFALRALAVIQIVTAVRIVVMALLRDRLIARLRGGESFDSVHGQFEVINRVAMWTHSLSSVLVVAGLVVLGLALVRGRGLALAAAGATGLSFTLFIISNVLPPPREP